MTDMRSVFANQLNTTYLTDEFGTAVAYGHKKTPRRAPSGGLLLQHDGLSARRFARMQPSTLLSRRAQLPSSTVPNWIRGGSASSHRLKRARRGFATGTFWDKFSSTKKKLSALPFHLPLLKPRVDIDDRSSRYVDEAEVSEPETVIGENPPTDIEDELDAYRITEHRVVRPQRQQPRRRRRRGRPVLLDDEEALLGRTRMRQQRLHAVDGLSNQLYGEPLSESDVIRFMGLTDQQQEAVISSFMEDVFARSDRRRG